MIACAPSFVTAGLVSFQAHVARMRPHALDPEMHSILVTAANDGASVDCGEASACGIWNHWCNEMWMGHRQGQRRHTRWERCRCLH
jgi:hypothetical protein